MSADCWLAVEGGSCGKCPFLCLLTPTKTHTSFQLQPNSYGQMPATVKKGFLALAKGGNSANVQHIGTCYVADMITYLPERALLPFLAVIWPLIKSSAPALYSEGLGIRCLSFLSRPFNTQFYLSFPHIYICILSIDIASPLPRLRQSSIHVASLLSSYKDAKANVSQASAGGWTAPATSRHLWSLQRLMCSLPAIRPSRRDTAAT